MSIQAYIVSPVMSDSLLNGSMKIENNLCSFERSEIERNYHFQWLQTRVRAMTMKMNTKSLTDVRGICQLSLTISGCDSERNICWS